MLTAEWKCWRWQLIDNVDSGVRCWHLGEMLTAMLTVPPVAKSASVCGHPDLSKLRKKLKRDRKISEPPSFHKKYYTRWDQCLASSRAVNITSRISQCRRRLQLGVPSPCWKWLQGLSYLRIWDTKYRVSQKKVGSQKTSNCSNSLNFEAKI